MKTWNELTRLGYEEEHLNAFRKVESFYAKCDHYGCDNYFDVTNSELTYRVYGFVGRELYDYNFCSLKCLARADENSEIYAIEYTGK